MDNSVKSFYSPGEEIVVIARDSSGGQKTIFYDTSYRNG